MVQVPADQEVLVVAVRHLIVAATRRVLVSSRVLAAPVLRRASGRIAGADADLVLVDVTCV
jgi:hypothetical protein